MRVEVENCNGLVVGSLQGSKSRESDRVITTECDELRVDVGGWTRVRERTSGK